MVQRVTTCILNDGNDVLMLQKPRRNWWVAPGGKMEQGESIKEAVVREFKEETGLFLKQPQLKGVFNILMKDGDHISSEWMMFTFYADAYEGLAKTECDEGRLAWQAKETVSQLPMAEGDYHIFDYVLNGSGIMYGTFTYTLDFELLAYRLDPS